MSQGPQVVYSNVWEDPELNRLSLQVKEGESVISITSGGCNSLCLLLENPGRLVSIDLNPAQLSMLEFKRAAIQQLDYEDYLEALGVEFFRKPSGKSPEYRVQLYRKIREQMPAYAREFWDGHEDQIRSGLFMCGKVEHFFALYRKALGWLYDYDLVEELFTAPDLEEQHKRYKAFRKKRWRFLNSLLLNRFVLGLVKGGHSFAQVDDKNLSQNLNRKIDLAMKRFYNPDNFFMSNMLLGAHYSRDAMSPYLLEKNFGTLKQNIDRLEIYAGTIEDVLKRYGKESFDKFNLSNIFEWMDHDFFNAVIRDVIALSRPGSRYAWRYTLAKPRILDDANSRTLILEPELSRQLFAQDRAFIYESFFVYHLAE